MQMSKTQRTVFEKELLSIHRSNRRFYAKSAPEVTDAMILKQIKDGVAKPRAKVSERDKDGNYLHGVEKFFVVPARDEHRKREKMEEEKADKRAAKFDSAYYKACDALASTESNVVGAKIVKDFAALAKQLTHK